jgi:hypothetical protein
MREFATVRLSARSRPVGHMGARREVSRTPLRSAAESLKRFATKPWSRFEQRLPAPYGGDGCADCRPRGVSRSIKIGRPGSDSRPGTSMRSSKSPHSALRGPSSRIEARCFARRLLRPADLPEQIALARHSLSLLRAKASGAGQDVQTKLGIAIFPPDHAERSHSFDEESDGLVAT